MASAIIGALRVNLGLNSASFSDGLTKSRNNLKNFSAKIKAAFLAASAAVVAAGVAISYAVKKMAADFDTAVKTADKIGIAVEDLQRLRYAAELSGVATNTLDMAMQRFARRVAEAAKGGGELKATLEQYNIAVKDSAGNTRTQMDILRDLADVIKNAENDQERLRIAFKAFDSEGAALVNTLRDGTAGLTAMMNEADRFGIVIGRDTAKSAESFNDNLTRLSKVQQGIITQVSAQLLPVLENFSNMLVNAASNAETMAKVSMALEATFKTIASAAVVAYAGIQAVVNGAKAWLRIFQDIKNGDFADIMKIEIPLDPFTDALKTIRQIWDETALGPIDLKPILRQRITTPIQATAQIARKSLSGITNEFKKLSDQLDDLVGDRVASAARIFASTRNPLERYEAQLAEINDVYQNGFINAETYARAVKQVREAVEGEMKIDVSNLPEAKDAINELGDAARANKTAYESWMRSVSDGLADAVLKAQSFKSALKDILVQLAKAEVSNFIFNAFTGGKGGSILGGLGKKIGLPGFKDGGSFKVGGAGGIDSQAVAFKATPGERVDISKSGDNGGMGGVTVNVDARGATDPAAVRMAAHQAVVEAAPAIIKAAKGQTISDLSRPRFA